MVSNKIQEALNHQIQIEAESSQIYLAMASWAEVQGFEGVGKAARVIWVFPRNVPELV